MAKLLIPRRRFLLGAAATLFIPAAPAIIRPAAAQLMQTGAGKKAGGGGGGGYVGPGDVVSGAVVWWGIRAYTQATIGASLIRVRRDSDQAEMDVVSAAGGSLNLASVFDSWAGGANVFVTTFYDQSGNGRNQGQATAGLQAQLINTGLGHVHFVRATGGAYLATLAAGSQPVTLSTVAKRTGNFTNTQGIWGGVSRGAEFGVGANTLGVYGGTDLLATAADNTWHALQGVMNSTSSVINIDGTDTTGDAGTGYPNTFWLIGQFGSSFLDGDFREGGAWDAAWDATQRDDVTANQQTFWGF